MRNDKELNEYISYIADKYTNYKTRVEAAQEIVSHPDFSHITIKQSWEMNCVYFYVDNSPTRVCWAFTFDKEMKEYLVSPLDLAINNAY